MSARLGDVLYLAGCVLSLSWFTFAVAGGAMGIDDWDRNTVIVFGIFLIAPAVLFWSVGIACLYVLRGDTEIGILPAIAPRRLAKLVKDLYAASIGFQFFAVLGLFGWFLVSDLPDEASVRSAIKSLRPFTPLLEFLGRSIWFLICGYITVRVMIAVLTLPWREMKRSERFCAGAVFAGGLLMTSMWTAAAIDHDPHGNPNGWIIVVVLVSSVPLAWLLKRSGLLPANIDAAARHGKSENS